MDKDGIKSIMLPENFESVIYIIRGQKVMLDQDLAYLYGIEVKSLNQAVKRNINRFPADFMFQLNIQEAECSRSQIVTLKRGNNIKYLPYAFTEQGVAMLSSVLRSPQAVSVNIEIMRAFIRMRQMLVNQKEMIKELSDVKSFLLKLSNHTDREFKRVWNAIEKLSEPDEKEQRKIGFDLE